MNLFQEIVGIIGVCLLVAFAAGAIIGGLLKHVFFPSPLVAPSFEAKKLEGDLSAARKECVECLKTREALETRIKALESELARKKAAALTDDTPIVIKAEPPKASVTYETSNYLKAPEAASTGGIATGTAAKSGEALGLVAEHDNLEEIYGVGPKLATLLHGLGITRFKQIAQWTDAEIERIDARLAEFQGRIRRENWVQSARECHFKKYGEWL